VIVWWRGGYGRFSGEMRALELAMVSREAAQGKGACSPSSSPLPLAPSRGARHDMTHAGGRSHAEKRLGEATESQVRRAFSETKIMSVPGVEVTAPPYPADLPQISQQGSEMYAWTREWLPSYVRTIGWTDLKESVGPG
jgi:hypothetical protein